jgi:DNA-binding response OmpR family regulator/predicted Ser/Thr protein kinase
MTVPSEHLLVVDDDEMNRDLLSRRLRRRGYTVTVAEDGTEALALVARQRFDLVVLDVNMPHIDGLQVLRTLRKIHSVADLPVIMATARDKTGDVVHALQLGANDYVAKPLDFAILAARIDTQLNLKRARQHDSLPRRVHDADRLVGPPTETLGPLVVETRSVSASLPDPVHGISIGRYQTVERIGSGGMGTVYLARDPVLDRPVAIKFLREGLETDALRQRFGREARAAARLTHPNIVTIYDVGEHDGRPFMAMEFVPGETLAQLITRRSLSIERRLRLVEDLCDGLRHAHDAGVVHRDIKPANLILTPEGVLKILDFGIARMVDAPQSGHTHAGPILGSLNYMSPEQVGGRLVDHRSDIFATGVVFYELLSWTQAFPGTVRDGVMQDIVGRTPEPLRRLCPGLHEGVIAIVDRALQKAADDRYPDMETMRRDVAAMRQRLVSSRD